MKEKATQACHALCRTRVVEEIRLRNGTPTAEHLKLVLSVNRRTAVSMNDTNSLEPRLGMYQRCARAKRHLDR
jgi:hypothetical protein